MKELRSYLLSGIVAENDLLLTEHDVEKTVRMTSDLFLNSIFICDFSIKGLFFYHLSS